MTLSWDEIVEKVLAALSSEEREASVVYLDKRILPAGAVLRVDAEEMRTAWPAVMAFVDLEPKANWGHDCRYVLVNAETGELQAIEARMPPFLGGAPETLRVVWKPEAVPPWAVACE